MSLDIARSFTSLETYMDLYIYMYIDSGLELEKKPRVNNETRDEKAMESCPLHCNQLHVFHNIAVVNQFLNIKV